MRKYNGITSYMYFIVNSAISTQQKANKIKSKTWAEIMSAIQSEQWDEKHEFAVPSVNLPTSKCQHFAAVSVILDIKTQFKNLIGP